jgi:hypothetical protein
VVVCPLRREEVERREPPGLAGVILKAAIGWPEINQISECDSFDFFVIYLRALG